MEPRLLAFDLAASRTELVDPVEKEYIPTAKPNRVVTLVATPASIASMNPCWGIVTAASGLKLQRLRNCIWSLIVTRTKSDGEMWNPHLFNQLILNHK